MASCELIERRAVAPTLFRLVHREIGVGQHLDLAEAVEKSDPDARRDMNILLAERGDVAVQSFDELVCDGRRLGGIGPGKQQAELVATQPRQKVSPARPLLEQASDALQEIVP